MCRSRSTAPRQVRNYAGKGSFDMAVRALENLHEAGFKDAKIPVVMTRENVSQLR